MDHIDTAVEQGATYAAQWNMEYHKLKIKKEYCNYGHLMDALSDEEK